MKKIDEYFDEEALLHDDKFIKEMGMALFYDEIENQINKCSQKSEILVIGCGTGLELERIKFACNVTALDISHVMLEQLLKKNFYPEMNLQAICMSVLDFDFGKNKFDIILTCYTLHHFNEEQKVKLYSAIHGSLKSGGVFINGDTIAQSTKEQVTRMKEANTIYRQQNALFSSLHIDVPLTKENEVALLSNAGFQHTLIEKEWTNTVLFRCLL